MTAEQKFYNAIREYLILKEGYQFLRLSEKNQETLIVTTIHDYIKSMKNEK